MIKGVSRIYGRVEASTDSLELADQDVSSRFLLITVGRRGRAGVQGIMTGREFHKDFDVGSLSKAFGFYLNSIRQCRRIGHKRSGRLSTELGWLGAQSLCPTALK